MTPNEVIYYIRQNRELSETWKQFSREEKEDIIRRMEKRELAELPKTMLEVKTGQNRLF
jgi:predicted lipase